MVRNVLKWKQWINIIYGCNGRYLHGGFESFCSNGRFCIVVNNITNGGVIFAFYIMTAITGKYYGFMLIYFKT